MARQRVYRPYPGVSGYIVGAIVAIGLLTAAGVLVAQAWRNTARQTVGEQGATVWLVVKVGAGLAVAGGLGYGAWRAGLAVYDALYGRWLDRRHDGLSLEGARQHNALNAIRVLEPDAHGRQGVAFDGRVFRDLDSKASYGMERNIYLDPVLETLNAQQKLMTAMYGMMVRGGDVAQLVANNEPEAAPVVTWPTRVPLRGLLEGRPSFHDVVLGLTMAADGTPEIVRADMATLVHCAIGGSSGWGKSVFLRSLAYQLAGSAERVDLAMIDLEGATLAPFATCERLLWPLADNERDAAAILGELTGELDRRKAMFAQYPGVDSLRAYNDLAAEPMAPIVAIIDECTALLEDKTIEGALRTLALRSRKFGVWLVLAGQDWKATTLDSAIRNQLSSRVQFKAMSASQSRVLLQQAGAEDLDARGRALAWLPGRELITLQAPIVSAEEIAAAVGGRGPRGELPSQERDAATQVRTLAGQGASKRQIALAVYGYDGGAAFRKVTDILGATTVGPDEYDARGAGFDESATVVLEGVTDAMG